MTDYAGVSFWLETAGDLTPRPPVDGAVEADVAILGAGFTGLWTAYYLLSRRPSARVVVVEGEIAGFGGSGRNGAWCSAAIGVTPGELARRYGADVARATQQALRATVDEVGRVDMTEDLDAGFHKGGLLRIARGDHERAAMRATYDQRVELGLADGLALLDAAQLDQRVRVAGARGALFDPQCATVHPGRLVRGLAAAVERRGATIYETTPVTGFTPRRQGRRPRLHTRAGDVAADTVVLAGEAYLAGLRPLHRTILPVYSLVVLTQPLSAAQLRQVGWAGRECLSSHRYTVDYLSRTPDGRILFGGRGAPYHLGSRIAEAYDSHPATHAMLRRMLSDWFPMLDGVAFTHSWGGPVALPRDFMPTIRYAPGTGMAGAWGYAGQGVAAANLSGRALADLITGARSDLTTLPMVGHRSPRWEPEPLRWLGIRYTQSALARIDAKAARTGRKPRGRSVAERLIRH